MKTFIFFDLFVLLPMWAGYECGLLLWTAGAASLLGIPIAYLLAIKSLYELEVFLDELC